MTHQHYSLGFVFCEEFSNGPGVLLMEKKRPHWQKGFLNGIGGKVEPDEWSDECMEREAREEIGLSAKWEQFASMGNNNYTMYIYRAFVDFDTAFNIKAQEDEAIRWVPLKEIPWRSDIIKNLRFLVPLGFYKYNKYDTVHFEEV